MNTGLEIFVCGLYPNLIIDIINTFNIFYVCNYNNNHINQLKYI